MVAPRSAKSIRFGDQEGEKKTTYCTISLLSISVALTFITFSPTLLTAWPCRRCVFYKSARLYLEFQVWRGKYPSRQYRFFTFCFLFLFIFCSSSFSPFSPPSLALLHLHAAISVVSNKYTNKRLNIYYIFISHSCLNRWELASGPAPRSWHAAAIADASLVVFGGVSVGNIPSVLGKRNRRCRRKFFGSSSAHENSASIWVIKFF